jgi:SAM-dependent methyltransferase
MTGEDIIYIKALIEDRVLQDPVLELGTGYGGTTCRELVLGTGLRYYGTDIESSPHVDFVADFDSEADMRVFEPVAPFGSVLVLNVLEHTFNPVKILDNCLTLLRSGGVLVILTPTIWPLHNYPMDTWRINPNFYEIYAQRRSLHLNRKYTHYVGKGPIEYFRSEDGSYSYPRPGVSDLHYRYSLVIHKIFNTFGRGVHCPPHLAIAAVFSKDSYNPAPSE